MRIGAQWPESPKRIRKREFSSKKKISADKLPDSRTDGRGRWGGRALSSDGPRMTTSPRWRSHNPGTWTPRHPNDREVTIRALELPAILTLKKSQSGHLNSTPSYSLEKPGIKSQKQNGVDRIVFLRREKIHYIRFQYRWRGTSTSTGTYKQLHWRYCVVIQKKV